MPPPDFELFQMTDTQSAIVGRTLGRYQLLASVARGGMGQVWLGRLQGARGFHKLVAVKTLLAPEDEAGRFERMLLEEARIASLIHHPNVVHTLELGEDDATLYMVMEWVDGEPLTHVLAKSKERGGLPINIAANIIAQTLRGLHAAHELCDSSGASLGVVHRDVSPHNVLVTYSGTAKLLDFGIAKATKQKSVATVTGEVKGKFAYMAPEQVLGTAIDRRTDLFAVGIMLYTLTVGRHPFKHHNDAGVLHAITSESPAPRPSSFVPDYPPALEAVVMRSLEKDIERRFANADEMRHALELAVPAASAMGDPAVGKYMGEILGENATARREAVRRTLLRADAHTPNPSASALATGSQSVGSLGAVAVDRRGTGSGVSGSGVSASNTATPGGAARTVSRLDSKLPLARSRKRYQAALVAAVAIAGAAVFVAAKALVIPSSAVDSRPATASPVVPVAEPEKVPLPVSPEAPLPAGSVREPEPAVTALASAKPVPSQRPAAKAKRDPKPAAPAGGDLIAPDYAR
jgi:eukaryotic-like serine/threonine-protein kinase